LVDTLTDYRNEDNTDIPKVEDETLTDSSDADNKDETNNSDDITNHDDSKQSKIDRFFKNNILTMEE
jgi:hypothetical protein